MAVWQIVLLSGILLSVILIASLVLIDRKGTNLDWNTEDILATTLCVIAAISIFGTLFGTPIVAMFEEEYYKVQYEDIYSVRGMNNESEGSFLLGTGAIDEETYYYVFVKDTNGYKLEKYNTRDTHIVEVDDGNYYVVIFKEKWTNYDQYILFVPIGTIFFEYRI